MTDSNAARASRCAAAIRHYPNEDTNAGHLLAFLADARHWCDLHGLGYADLDRLAYGRYVEQLLVALAESHP